MEIFMLVLMYYLSQNPNFAESVKPLMGQLKNSEEMLKFLNDLSRFTKTFSTFQNGGDEKKESKQQQEKEEEQKERQKPPEKEKEPRSPTSGIADDYIQQILEGYLKKR